MGEKSVSIEEANVAEMYKDPVPYLVYESTMARFERTIKRLIIVIGIAIALLFASNMAWLYEWNQYDYGDVDVNTENGGNANYIGASGMISNGTSTGES